MYIEQKNTKYLPFKLKAGKEYWFGDPCYVLGADHLWDRLCDVWFAEKDDANNGIMVHDEGEWIFMTTAYGDGGYNATTKDGKHMNCGVDAGLLSCIPVELINQLNPNYNDNERGLGLTFTPEKDTYIYANLGTRDGWNRKGFNWDGAINCVTDGSDDEEEDYYDDEDDEFSSE